MNFFKQEQILQQIKNLARFAEMCSEKGKLLYSVNNQYTL